MNKVTLHIETFGEPRTVSLEDEISIGRTHESQVVIDDAGLSRKNTTFFRDGNSVLIVDEDSTNGTFLNGERISGRARRIYDGDEIKIGSGTRISVEITTSAASSRAESSAAAASGFSQDRTSTSEAQNPESRIPNPKSEKPPLVLIGSVAATFLIVLFGFVIFLVARMYESGGGNEKRPTAQMSAKSAIPIRVIDPLGGQDPEDIDDFISSWEVEEEQLEASDIEEIKTVSPDSPIQPSDLKVSVEFWQTQMKKSLNHPGVNEPLQVPVEMLGRGVPKQTAKLAELINSGVYKQPLDFADLAELRLKNILVELPMATEHYVLDVGGSATEAEFTSYDFENGSQPIPPGSPKYQFLQQLANNFDGQKYDLNKGSDRKQMRIRLLRMYNPKSRKLLEELSKAYAEKFRTPLRITSLVRSMDYQISLNKTNGNSFVVKGKGSLPPHTSGCAFDLSRRNLSSGEQNFLMAKFAELERSQNLDSLIEGSSNPCFHTFIFPDGAPAQSSPAKK